MADGLFSQCFLDFESWTSKSHHFLADAFLNNLIQPDESAAANEEDFLGVDLNVFLVRVFAPALWRNVAGATLENLQKGLLNAFTGDIAGNAHVIGFAPNLVDLVDVNDADLGSFHIIIGILQESQNDVLDIFTDIAGFGQRGRVRDAEWDIENPGQRFSQQSFTGAGRSDQQNVALLNFNFSKWVRLECRRCISWRRSLQNTLVMVVHRHRKRLFGDLLPNHILVERAPDFCRLRHAKVGGLAPGVLVQLFIEDAFANVYATVADIDSGPGDQFAHLGVTLATKRAHGEVGSASHTWSLEKELLSCGLSRQSGLSDFYRSVAGRRGCAVEQLHFLARLNYFVHQTVRLRLLSGHVVIAIRIDPHLFLGFTGVLSDDFDEAFL